MELTLYLLVFSTVTVATYYIYRTINDQRVIIKSRLKDLEYLDVSQKEDDELKLSLSERLIKPTYLKIIKFLGNIAPKNYRDQYEKLIEISGVSKNMTFNRLLGLQLLFSIFFGLLIFIILDFTEKPSFLLSLFAATNGFLFPVVSLKRKVRKRQAEIQNALPDMLDLLYVSVEAGLGFDMAVQRTTEKMKGPLTDEMKKGLDEINKGKRREDALRAIAKRTDVRDVSTFITAVIQTEQLGSNIANMLRVQSNSMRQKRRQRAEEKANKAPVKILFPMVFFIFPPLFIVILGPAIINVFINFL